MPVRSLASLTYPVREFGVELVEFQKFPSILVHYANALIAETMLSVFQPTMRSALFFTI